MIEDYLQPTPPLMLENRPRVAIENTGSAVPFLSADAQGNVVLGASLIANSFAAPTGSTVNFESGVIV